MFVNAAMPNSSLEKFRGLIKDCQANHRSWLNKNVVARGLHIPYALFAIASATVNAPLGVISGGASIVCLGRYKKLNAYSNTRMESLASLLPNLYNAVLGIINPHVSLSEDEIVTSYSKKGLTPPEKIRFISYVFLNGNSSCLAPADKINRGSDSNRVVKIVESICYLTQAVVLRTTSLGISILLGPLDIIALGSHKSLHNIVLQGLRAPGIVEDVIVFVRDCLN